MSSQKLITRNKIKVNIDQYTRLLNWMIANNPKTFGDIDVNNPPVPAIFDKNDDSTENLRDPASVDRDVVNLILTCPSTIRRTIPQQKLLLALNRTRHFYGLC